MLARIPVGCETLGLNSVGNRYKVLCMFVLGEERKNSYFCVSLGRLEFLDSTGSVGLSDCLCPVTAVRFPMQCSDLVLLSPNICLATELNFDKKKKQGG
jgi:hypothetical protein